MSNQSAHLNLAKFAFNIYGTLNSLLSLDPNGSPQSSASSKSRLYFPPSDNLQYSCEKEVNTLTDLELLPNNGFNCNVVLGGKNYLKLLILNLDQTSILNEANILEPASSSVNRLPGNAKLHNFNTIKSFKNTIAGGMVNGTVVLYQVLNNGKSRVIRKFTDHKRCINSLDFLDPQGNDMTSNLLISGSQDGSIKLWDLRSATSKPSMNIVLKSNYDSVRSCQFSPHSVSRNKLVVLSAHDSGTLNKYDLRAVSHASTPERKWNSHTGPALSLSIHPTKEYVLTCGRDQKVCAWTYSDVGNSYSNAVPDYVVNTYGPVMKVRWSPYANQKVELDYDEDVSYDDIGSSHSNDLFDYDFACLYLNEDPTITVYNLKKKYVPKEIVNSYSHKPYLNFIWAKNSQMSRKLWTVTKGSQFMSRSLDSNSEYDNITRPKDMLNPVSMTWGTSPGEISFIGQEESDFGNETKTRSDSFSETAYDLEVDYSPEGPDSNEYNKLIVGSAQSGVLNSPPSSSLGSSPLESPSFPRPLLLRSSTHGTPILSKFPPSSPKLRNSMSSYSMTDSSLKRPHLRRNLSTDSNALGSQNKLDAPHDYRRTVLIYHASPYVIPVLLPLPLNDDVVFEVLSNNYLLTIPDGFSLVDVCHLNASVAASVNRFRDCQVWRMLAVGLGQHVDGILDEHEYEEEEYLEDVPTEPDENNDNKSVLSDYANLNFGSYNSNSTLTTNYGGSELIEKKSSTNPHSWNENSSSHNLLEILNQNRNNSFKASITIGSLSPSASRSNSMIAQVNNLRIAGQNNDDNENAVEDDEIETKETTKSETNSRDQSPEKSLLKFQSAPTLIPKPRTMSASPPKKSKSGTSPRNIATLNRIHLKRNSFVNRNAMASKPNDLDLDNENLHVLNNAANGPMSTSAIHGTNMNIDTKSSMGSLPSNQMGSFRSRRSSSIAPSYGFTNTRPLEGELPEVDETTSANSQVDVESEIKGGLSKAFEDDRGKISGTLQIPWTVSNLLQKAISHAVLQGDTVMCSTLSLLFYPFIKSLDLHGIDKHACLEWISLYIEILQRKRLFVNAMNILNNAPRDLQETLLNIYYGDNLRFYCQNCNELIVNEETKAKFNEGKIESFGYWFCEKCKTAQLTCVYCNEPCVGLNVVISLECGHRGHFGCLREWFVEDENEECPGGCNMTIF